MVLTGWWCDGPREEFLFFSKWFEFRPLGERMTVTYRHQAINHWQIPGATVKDVKPAAAIRTLGNFLSYPAIEFYHLKWK